MSIRSLLTALPLATLCACASSATLDPSRAATEKTLIDGALKLELSDSLATPGVMWALPSITTETGAVVVAQTQYGSLCSEDVTGAASVQTGHIELRMSFVESLWLCTAEIRALRYKATISAPSGTYAIVVVRAENNQVDTLRTATVVVP